MKPISELKINKTQIKRLANNLRSLMHEKNISENELARILDIPSMTVRRIVSGETADPRISTLKLIADYFDITIDSLIHEETIPRKTTSLQKNLPQFIPVFDWETASSIKSIANFDLKSWKEWQPIAVGDNLKLGHHAFAIPSRPSMHSRYPTGTLFVIDPDERPVDGDLVLVKIINNDELTIRELHIDPPLWILHPLIPGSEPLPYEQKKYKIVGVIVLTMLYTKK